ncbi:MAG TPA: hypothetical protein VM121_09465 [Acidimicrobiales bacterium]|nr:hypothetical protein [Acidimicrobiales bacterium]
MTETARGWESIQALRLFCVSETGPRLAANPVRAHHREGARAGKSDAHVQSSGHPVVGEKLQDATDQLE